jgi:hypothetical protein
MTTAHPPDTQQASVDRPAALRYGRHAAVAGVMVIAALGFVMSWDAVSTYARPSFGDMAPTIPLMLDLTVAFASLWYVLGARSDGRRRTGWRTLAHTAVAATLAMNGLAGLDGPRKYLPLYLIGPAVWSAVVELVAKEALNQWQAATRPQRIDRALWIVAPWESAATWLRAARTASLTDARRDAGQESAALELVRLAILGRTRSAWSARHVLRRQVRSGALAPAAVVAELGAQPPARLRDPQALQWRVLVSVLTQPPTQVDPEPGRDAGDPATPAVEVRVIDHQPTPIGSQPTETAHQHPLAVEAASVGSEPASASGPVGRVPGEPGGSLPGPVGRVPDSDAAIVAAILSASTATGHMPTVNAIRTHFGVGHSRATRLRATAEATAAHHPPWPGTPRLVSRSVTAEDLRSIPSVNGSSHHDSQEEAQEESQK